MAHINSLLYTNKLDLTRSTRCWLILATIDPVSIYNKELRNRERDKYPRYSRSAIKNQFGNLSALDTRSICALRRALKLKSNIANGHLRHSFLPEITQFRSVQDHRSRVKRFRFDLDRVFEVHAKRVTRTVREEFSIVFGQHATSSSKFYFYIIIGPSIRRAIQSETDDEYTLIYAELDAIASTSIAPLIVAVR